MQDRPVSHPHPLPKLLKGQTFAPCGMHLEGNQRELELCCSAVPVLQWTSGDVNKGGEGESFFQLPIYSGRREAWELKTLQHCLLELTEHVQNHCPNDKHCNKYWQDMNPAYAKASFFFFFPIIIKAAQITFFFITSLKFILHPCLDCRMVKEMALRTVFCRAVVEMNTKQLHKTTKYLATF